MATSSPMLSAKLLRQIAEGSIPGTRRVTEATVDQLERQLRHAECRYSRLSAA